jgi:hypothetical protein
MKYDLSERASSECPSNVDVASLKAEFCTNIKMQMVIRFAIRFLLTMLK